MAVDDLYACIVVISILTNSMCLTLTRSPVNGNDPHKTNKYLTQPLTEGLLSEGDNPQIYVLLER